MWDGELAQPESLLLKSYCSTFSISEEAATCAWWLVLSSEEIKVDQKHLSRLALLVQNKSRITQFGKDKDNVNVEVFFNRR